MRASPTFPACLILTLLACTGSLGHAQSEEDTLPEQAAPKGHMLDVESTDLSDVISYRTLVRSDFKGTRPPPEFGPDPDLLAAATCAYLYTSPDTQARTRPVRSRDGTLRYEAWLEGLRFVAQMDRKCSWWNPRKAGVAPEYVLEHEQIHFAIVELEARRLNASAHELESELRSSAADSEAAVHAVEQRLTQRVEERMKDVLTRSREFDEDTSMGRVPERQRRWWDLVQGELAALDPSP